MTDRLAECVATAEAALANADLLRLFEVAREGLEIDPDHPRLRYLQVLTLARLGDTETAAKLFQVNRIDQLDDEDALALEARIAKNVALAAHHDDQPALMQQASDAYRRVFERTGGYYPQINAATTALLAGNATAATAMATQMLTRRDIKAPSDYYAAATQAEARLLLGDIDGAISTLARAVTLPGADMGNFPTSIRQFRLIAAALGLPADTMTAICAPFRTRPVLSFCGHLFAENDPGEAALTQRIADAIRPLGPCIAFGALACGADILIAEAVLAQGGELHVVLPFDEADFIALSVAPGGESWIARYHQCRNRATDVTFATKVCSIGDDGQFGYGSYLAMGIARLRSDATEAEAWQLAIAHPDALLSGSHTARDIKTWEASGGRTIVIDPGPMARPTAGKRVPQPANAPKRAFRAILFADFAGYSRLGEDQLAVFMRDVMGALDKVFDRFTDRIESRNTWGDAVHAVLTSVEAAVGLAQAIHAELTSDRLLAIGLPQTGGMRISLHYGPVYLGIDPVTKQTGSFGTEVTLAARIEPKVPIGAIYVTQQFAAIARMERLDMVRFGYIGKLDLPKNYGSSVIYRVQIER